MLKSMPPKIRFEKRKRKTDQEILDQLKKFLDENQDEPVEFLCGVWDRQQHGITYGELKQLAESGAIDTKWLAQWSDDYNALVTEHMEPLWRTAMEAGAQSPKILSGTGFVWDVQRPKVAEWIMTRGGTFADNCTAGQVEAIRALLEFQFTEQLPIDHFCQMIMPCIGLTPAQSKTVWRMYGKTKAQLIKDHPKMTKESAHKKAARIAQQKAAQLHQYRAVVIAQTEMAAAYNFAAQEAIVQAQEERLIGPVVRRWCTSGDARVCETCVALDGVEVGMDEDFKASTPKGGAVVVDVPPAHSFCGCAVQYIEVT